jgi:hypothetical protein
MYSSCEFNKVFVMMLTIIGLRTTILDIKSVPGRKELGRIIADILGKCATEKEKQEKPKRNQRETKEKPKRNQRETKEKPKRYQHETKAKPKRRGFS